MTPAISVLIRTCNSARTLPLVLDRLSLAPDDELVIVDSGSTDGTLKLASQWNAHILKLDGPFNYSRSLNAGFAAAKNQWVLVISSHCVPQSQNLLASFRQAVLNFPATVAVAYGKNSLIEYQPDPDEQILFADKTATADQRQRVYGGNGLALYRRECWQKQPFDESVRTAEDLVWFLGAMANGALAANVPQARVLYRNQGSLRHMFLKGWWESRLAAKLVGEPPMTFFGLTVNLTSLFKKWATAQIPFNSLWRQSAHAVGAYLSPKFAGSRKIDPSNQ